MTWGVVFSSSSTSLVSIAVKALGPASCEGYANWMRSFEIDARNGGAANGSERVYAVRSTLVETLRG